MQTKLVKQSGQRVVLVLFNGGKNQDLPENLAWRLLKVGRNNLSSVFTCGYIFFLWPAARLGFQLHWPSW